MTNLQGEYGAFLCFKFPYAVLSGIGMEYQTRHMLLLRRELFTHKL